MKLIIIYGPPGVGKLTVAEKLTESTGLKLLHNHMIADLIVPVFGLRTPASIEFSAAVRKLIYEIAVRNNVPGIVSTVIYYPGEQAHQFIRDCAKIMAEHGGELFVIQLTASLDSLKQRVSDESRKGTRKITSADKLEQVITSENLMTTIPESVTKSLIIDSTNLTASEVVEKIKPYCGIPL